MTTPAQPFDVEAAISKICGAYWGPNVDQAADIDDDLINAMRTQITAALEAVPLAAGALMPEPVQPALYQYQSKDGTWQSFINESHHKNTIAAGDWPIRALYTSLENLPQPVQQAVMPEPVQANFPNDAAIMAMMRNAIGKQSLDIAELHEEVRYLKETLKDQTTTAQPVPPDEQTEFTSSTYDPPGLSNWLVGHDKGVRVTHRSGLFEQCHSERGYHANEALAMSRLKDRLAAQPVQPAFEGDAA